MVDMVTKDSIVYQMPGATEEAAQGSAQGKVQHLGYQATFPLILNIDGQPTYFMALKDAACLSSSMRSYRSKTIRSSAQARRLIWPCATISLD